MNKSHLTYLDWRQPYKIIDMYKGIEIDYMEWIRIMVLKIVGSSRSSQWWHVMVADNWVIGSLSLEWCDCNGGSWTIHTHWRRADQSCSWLDWQRSIGRCACVWWLVGKILATTLQQLASNGALITVIWAVRAYSLAWLSRLRVTS